MVVPCFRAFHEFFREMDCPALVWDGARYVCLMAAAWGDSLAIDEGCDTPANPWRKNVRQREEYRWRLVDGKWRQKERGKK
jgi:hypothetical protein